ncbi:type 2 isopentenyl-diphosphate Delta-isomerase [Paenibacillus hamazuiensis]|uniref:type 2 isopentenyl-diphosphate Delta-isomerase n=1 Tax=Paenibacillus hamazuiensis TaxID=2936508 RepID=UPI00200CE6A0|nr:type 2 isopentenyl-diphosphate Delta-isomerase [Paenibacillus hamazuiensis]
MRISRKMEHVRHALQLGQSGNQGFADIKLIHSPLPGTSVEHISLSTRIGDLILSSPIIINAMTGGARETEAINRELAVAAREQGLAMAVGSQMSALKNEDVAGSYKIVRKMNPQGIVFANLGSEATVEQAKRAVDMIEANALQIHLNAMQELIMPEGDRDFRGAAERIAEIAASLDVPVIVKEVGFGLNMEAARSLIGLGIRIIDVGGFGGTNFAAIENARRTMPMEWLNDWGVKTSIALLETLQYRRQACIIASGGIISSLDICKSLVLGASAVGIAGRFLKVLQEQGTGGLIGYIGTLKDELKLLMTALGVSSVEALTSVPAVITGETAEWCELRGIDRYAYARRGLE